MSEYNDLLGYEDDGKPVNVRAKKARKNLGDLHELLTAKLPDLVDPQSKVCDLHKIAKARGMSFQGVYRWFRDHNNNRVPYTQAMWLIELSGRQKTGGPKFAPLTFEEVKPFITAS